MKFWITPIKPPRPADHKRGCMCWLCHPVCFEARTAEEARGKALDMFEPNPEPPPPPRLPPDLRPIEARLNELAKLKPAPPPPGGFRAYLTQKKRKDKP